MKAYACPFGSALEGTSRTSLGFIFLPCPLCFFSERWRLFFSIPPPLFLWEGDASEMRRKRRRRCCLVLLLSLSIGLAGVSCPALHCHLSLLLDLPLRASACELRFRLFPLSPIPPLNLFFSIDHSHINLAFFTYSSISARGRMIADDDDCVSTFRSGRARA